MWPLNPFLFPARPLVTDIEAYGGEGVHHNILHQPYWWHANWAAGEAPKIKALESQGDWLYRGP